jgi:hypothetical protein
MNLDENDDIFDIFKHNRFSLCLQAFATNAHTLNSNTNAKKKKKSRKTKKKTKLKQSDTLLFSIPSDTSFSGFISPLVLLI